MHTCLDCERCNEHGERRAASDDFCNCLSRQIPIIKACRWGGGGRWVWNGKGVLSDGWAEKVKCYKDGRLNQSLLGPFPGANGDGGCRWAQPRASRVRGDAM